MKFIEWLDENDWKTTERLSKMTESTVINKSSTDTDLLREAIYEEYKVVNLYLQMARQAKDERVRKVLEHVAYEEKVHIGEFEELLEILDPKHEEAEEEGEEELKSISIYNED